MIKKIGLAMLFFLLVITYQSGATHLRAGEITVQRVGCSRTFIITIKVFTNTKNTNVLFGGDGTAILDFGDGNVYQVPEEPNIIRTDLDPTGAVATASFSISHTYSSDEQYTISYKEPNRNQGVLNMDNSVDTEFYIETVIDMDPFYGCNSSPVLSVPPIDKGCVGVAWFHNPGASDPDGDSLSYELVIPFQDRNLSVVNYKAPNNSKFYSNFNTGNETASGPPTFSINHRDGTITWNAPGAVGEYNIAFHVIEWRNIKGTWYKIGYVRRDMQIIIDDCKDKRPELQIPNDTCIVAGTTLKAKIIGTDPDVNDKVKVEAFSEIFSISSPATTSPAPAFADQPYEMDFEWKTNCGHVREQPYQVVFKITDNTASRLATFKTWFITVVGPAPKWVSAAPVLPKRYIDLAWESYACNKEAETMQIWRRVGETAFTPDNCETGMPEFLGYTKIDEIPLKDATGNAVTTYRDTNNKQGLAPGARYCYRLVAIFPKPRGGESYVSQDICVDPFDLKAPVITNVSVDRTDLTNGKISVKWVLPPTATADSYKAYRAVGSGTVGTTEVYNGAALEFIDSTLNTTIFPYSYRIISFLGGVVQDTSAIASSVRLEAQALVKKIQLNWSANVPWSNRTQTYPEHLIFRGAENAKEADLVLIGSVDVNVNGFVFIDDGSFNSQPLVDGQTYTYRVMTRGDYGNVDIPAPLENFSQIISAQPGDSIPPCKPSLLVKLNDCTEYFTKYGCNATEFSNTLYWNRPTDACGKDILGYKIYYSASSTGEFTELTGPNKEVLLVKDTFFIHNYGLTSFAACYKIAAVDRSLNVSDLSDPVCNDNCPYYELPNVFTPGNGDECNNLFSAYGKPNSNTGEESSGNTCKDADDGSKCARFVERVDFKVFNRWGKEVYTFNYPRKISDGKSTGENNQWIDWDGRDNAGVELSSGVYYYIADVTFTVVDPDKKTRTYKGWVHLLR